MGIRENIAELEKIADAEIECYCPDDGIEYWNCKSCFASAALNEMCDQSSVVLSEIRKEKSEYVR